MSSSDTPKTVILDGCPVVHEAVAAASSSIKPGHLLELTSAGTVRKEQTDPAGPNGPRAKMFALEAGYVGGDIDDTYADGDTVTYGVFSPGQRVYAWLGTNESVAIGAQLQSAGDGTLEAVDSDGFALAIALEAVTTTGSAARIRVEVI